MDAFRRFRSRRKSKDQAESFTSFADAESSYRASTSLSSATVTRPSDVASPPKISHDQFRQPKPSFDKRPPTSNSRPQPMLVGITRPSLSNSRPGTAESIQQALDRAAESVKHQQSPRGAVSPSSRPGTRGGRYVDILAISGQTAKPTTFNEDVAERNLDTVLTIEEQHFEYKPASKFQEEVAARNAHQIAAQRASSLRQQTHGDNVKPNYERSASVQSGSYGVQPPQAETIKARHSQETNRQISSRAKGLRDGLPVIPQEKSIVDFTREEKNARKVRQAEQELEEAKARWVHARRQNQADRSPNIDKPLPKSPRKKEYMRDSGIASVSESAKRASDYSDIVRPQRQRQGSNTSYRGGGDNKAGQSFYIPGDDEPVQRPGIVTHEGSRTDRMHVASQKVDRVRSPSVTSNHPMGYKRVLVGNRTIMDLTADEDHDIRSEAASYTQTPVIEQATSDAFQKVIPTIIEQSSPIRGIERESVIPNSRWSSALEPVLDLDQLARRSQNMAEAARVIAAARGTTETKAPKRPRTPPQRPPQKALGFSTIHTLVSSSPPRKIAFSPINTLASTSPRSSQEIMPQALVASTTEKVDIETSDKQPTSNKRLSANITPLVKIHADVKPEAAEMSQPIDLVKSKGSGTDSKARNSSKGSGTSSKKAGKRRERFEEKEAIREAAKKIIPAGPLDQEPLPGVKTRDFAMVPVVKPTNKRIEALSERKRVPSSSERSSKERSSSSKSSSSERKSRSRTVRQPNKVTFDEGYAAPAPAKETKPDKKSEKKSSKKSGREKSTTSKNKRPISLFDEDSFAKKHAEANAALLRLKQSLQESLEADAENLLGTNPAERALTPAASAAPGSASPEKQLSPSVAAMAMIAAATSSPRGLARPVQHIKAVSEIGRKIAPAKPAPMSRAQTENITPTIKSTTMIMPQAFPSTQLLARVDNSMPPPSPGEVSLSAFPIPTPRALSPESNGPPAYVKDVGTPVRRGSQASRMSTQSAFSIPFTMVPSRMASLPEKRMGIPGASTTPQMESINAIIPPIPSQRASAP